MIRLLASAKGEGKTKRLINMANESAKVTNGHLVYIENDKRHMYDLHYDIRFIETKDYPITNYNEFFGFLCGILSQDRDVQTVYIDGILKIIEFADNELEKFMDNLNKLCETFEVDFVVGISKKDDELSDKLKGYLVI